MFWMEIVDAGQHNQLANGEFMFFALQSVQPAGRDLVGLIAPFPSKAKAPFFYFAQRELPLLTNRAKSGTDAIQERSPLADLACGRPFCAAQSGKDTTPLLSKTIPRVKTLQVCVEFDPALRRWESEMDDGSVVVAPSSFSDRVF